MLFLRDRRFAALRETLRIQALDAASFRCDSHLTPSV